MHTSLRVAPLVASALVAACGSAFPAPPTVDTTGVLPIARNGESFTSVNGVDIAHETYEDDGDTLACRVVAMGKAVTVRLSRVARTAHIEQDGSSVNRLLPPGTVVVANFCWQQLVVAAEEFRSASIPTPVRILVPSRDVARDGTIQVAMTPTGERHVTLVIEGVEISADIGKDGAVSRVAIPVQNAEARGHAGVTPEVAPTAPVVAAVDPVVVDEPFTIDRPEATVRGTLEMPKDVHTKIPVVLVVAGSGPTDRDGNSLAGLKTDAYKLLAVALAHKGIATLRFDKRGVGQSTFRGDVSKLVVGDFTEDARAIVLALQGDARFSTVSVLGHSEGGLLGLELTQTTPVAALVLVATPGRTFGAVVREQLARQVDAPTLQAVDRAFVAIRAGTKPQNLPTELAPLFNDRVLAYIGSEIDLKPAPLMATSKASRIAIVQGDMDMQVSVDDDAKKLASAFPKAKLTIVAGMAHTLKMEKARIMPQPSYLDPTLPLAAPLVDAVVAAVGSTP